MEGEEGIRRLDTEEQAFVYICSIASLILLYYTAWNASLGMMAIAGIEGTATLLFLGLGATVLRHPIPRARRLVFCHWLIALSFAIWVAALTMDTSPKPGLLLPFLPLIALGATTLLGWRAAMLWTLAICFLSEIVVIVARHGALDISRPPELIDQTIAATICTWGLAAIAQWNMENKRKEAEHHAQVAENLCEELTRVLHEVMPEPFVHAYLEGMTQIGSPKPISLDNSPLLIADFVSFTERSRTLPPEALLRELSRLFFLFDEIMDHFQLSRVKTVGDEYQAMGGLRAPVGNAPQSAVAAAYYLRHMLDHWRKSRIMHGLPNWGVRIGIHCGPCYAGMVGGRRMQFDVWGPSINIAHRIMTHSSEGEILVSRSVFEEIRGGGGGKPILV